MKEARFWESLEDQKVHCHLCAHECQIDPGKRGICRVRENRDGTLYSLVYGSIISENIDPIEKKPLYHFLPGSRSYSIATVGCNFGCLHCQNFEISQYPRLHEGAIIGLPRSPEDIVAAAIESQSASISYTYTEPTIFLEFAQDTARLARAQGLRNVFVSNGFMTETSAQALAEFIDADNVDLKSFLDDHYRKVCKARLQPVLDTIVRLNQLGVWLEITTLVIPGLNDSTEELTDIAQFVKGVGVGGSLACVCLLPHLQDVRPAPHSSGHPAKGPGGWAQGGIAVRLYRQYPRQRRGKYFLLCLRRSAYRPRGLSNPALRSQGQQVLQMPGRD